MAQFVYREAEVRLPGTVSELVCRRSNEAGDVVELACCRVASESLVWALYGSFHETYHSAEDVDPFVGDLLRGLGSQLLQAMMVDPGVDKPGSSLDR